MPWEIFRTEKILPSTRRPVTFFTKSGGYIGYRSLVIVLPEHDIGITILAADDTGFLDKTRDLITVFTIPLPPLNSISLLTTTKLTSQIPLVRTLDKLAMNQLDTYAGTYTFSKTTSPSSSTTSSLNTTLTLTRRLHYGLLLTSFISNNTDVLSFLSVNNTQHTRFQLFPTLLNVNESAQAGERWRVVRVDADPPDLGEVWGDAACITDVDVRSYAGKPLNEIVFWRGESGEVEEVELTAYRVRLGRVREEVVEVDVRDGEGWEGSAVPAGGDEL